MKKLLSISCAVLMFFSIAVFSVNSESSYNLSVLKNCKELLTYNGKNNSYVYGCTSDTLYSAKVLPSVKDTRYVSVDGLIRSVCHNDTYACALYEDNYKNRSYYVVQMNMIDGSCKYYNLGIYPELKNTSFAMTDNEIFIINTDSHNSYVMSFDLSGKKQNEYRFDSVVSEVFVNNSKAYACLYSGEIYYISNGKYQYVASINRGAIPHNAGVDWIYTDYKSLVSLKDSAGWKTYDAELNCIVNNNSVIYSDKSKIITPEGKYYSMSDNIIALVSSGNNIAVVLSDYSCKVITKSELKSGISNFSDNNSTNIGTSYYLDGNIIYGVQNGTTVSQFKNTFSSNVNVYDSDGNAVSSGKMKTGYSTSISGNQYYVAVRGDVTGEGNVKSNDVTTLMSSLAGKTELNGVFYFSADYNYDGKVNNQDLVLIAQKALQ